MDATGSMGGLIAKCKATVSDMYGRAYQIIKSKGILDDCIEMKFVVYRNYGEKVEQIMQSSGWAFKP